MGGADYMSRQSSEVMEANKKLRQRNYGIVVLLLMI